MYSDMLTNTSSRRSQLLYSNRLLIASSQDLPTLLEGVATAADSSQSLYSETNDSGHGSCEDYEYDTGNTSPQSDSTSVKYESGHPHRLSVISERTEPLSPVKDTSNFTFQASITVVARSGSIRESLKRMDSSSRVTMVRKDNVERSSDEDLHTSYTSLSTHCITQELLDSTPASRKPTKQLSRRSSSSSSSSIKAYPIPRWTIPSGPRPPVAPRHSSALSWATVANESEIEDLGPSIQEVPSPTLTRRSPSCRRFPPKRPETPISKLEAKVLQETMQVASLLGAPEPERRQGLRPTSFHQRVCCEMERSEARIVSSQDSTTNYATRAKKRGQSPLDSLASRLQGLTAAAVELHRMKDELDQTWGLVEDDGSPRKTAAYTQARFQTVGQQDRQARPQTTRMPSFIQCTQKQHQFYPIYPKQFFGMGNGAAMSPRKKKHKLPPLALPSDGSLGFSFDGVGSGRVVAEGSEEHDLHYMCDICNRTITRARWVCRVSDCGVEACTECKGVLE